MKIISQFDKNPIVIGVRSTRTTLVGSLVGILALIALAWLAVTKCVSVFNRDIIYLNNWRTE